MIRMFVINNLYKPCSFSNRNNDTFWVKVGKQKLRSFLIDISNLNEYIKLFPYGYWDSRMVKALTD